MTPEAIHSAMHMLDRFGVMVANLLRQPLPAPPDQRGRVIQAPPIPDPAQDAERLDAEARAARIWRALAADGEGSDLD